MNQAAMSLTSEQLKDLNDELRVQTGEDVDLAEHAAAQELIQRMQQHGSFL